MLELYFRGLTCPGQKKLAQDGISETLDTIFAREDIIQSLRPMEVASKSHMRVSFNVYTIV